MTTISLDRMPLEPDLAKQLARTVGNIDKNNLERERLIIVAYVGGASLRDIANHAGMTHVGVKKLIEREMPDWVLYKDGKVVAILEAKQPRGGHQGE